MAFLDEAGLAHLWQKIKGPLYAPTNVALQTIYQPGSLYFSTQPTNPEVLFGFGKWVQIEDVFLLAAGTKYQAGTTGGEATHTLSVDEMPSHDHPTFVRNKNADSNPTYLDMVDLNGTGPVMPGWAPSLSASSSRKQMRTNVTGGGAAHNNMPPYLAVYVWYRKE